MIPTQEENPIGLHQRYSISKVVPNPDFGTRPKYARHKDNRRFILKPVDRGAEYFVLRLDDGGSDPKHIAACRIAVNAYADAIEAHIPQLAADIRGQWPAALPSVEQTAAARVQGRYYSEYDQPFYELHDALWRADDAMVWKDMYFAILKFQKERKCNTPYLLQPGHDQKPATTPAPAGKEVVEALLKAAPNLKDYDWSKESETQRFIDDYTRFYATLSATRSEASPENKLNQ